MRLALEAPGVLPAPTAVSLGCQDPGGGSCEHSLKGTDSKEPPCGPHPWQASVCCDHWPSRRAVHSQELFLRAYFHKNVCHVRGAWTAAGGLVFWAPKEHGT